MFFSHQSEIPIGQRWLIDRMTALGYESDYNGVCFGISHMAMQAILAEELDQFYRRLKLIATIPLNKFKERINEITMARVELINKIKGEVKKENIGIDSLSKTELESLENDSVIQAELAALKKIISELNIDNESQTIEFENRKKDWLRNASLQKKIQNKIDETLLSLTDDERITFDIPAFFEGVEIYHQIQKYPNLFVKEKKPFTQDAQFSIPFVLSKKLKEQGGIVNVSNSMGKSSFTGVYDKDSLIVYFDALREAVQTTTPHLQIPLTLILGSSNHAVTVKFDPTQNTWQVIDPKYLQYTTSKISDTMEVANKVSSSLSKNGLSVFETKIYGRKMDEPILNSIILNLENSKSWRELHAVSPKKLDLLDSNNSSWLYIAARSGDLAKVKELLAANADANIKRGDDGTTPLFIAAMNGYTEVVKILMVANADPNAKSSDDGTTPLFVAAQNGHTDVVKILLTVKADPNVKRSTDGVTPLFMASQNGHTDIVKTLLAANADPNVKLSNGTTPLFFAAQDGHADVVKILLAANADPNIKRSTDGATPLFVAAQHSHADVVKILLAANADPNAELSNGATSLFIAAQKNQREIVDLLLKNEKIDTSLAFISTAASLREFAKNNNVAQAMEIFLQQKAIDYSLQNISVTPANIAEIMGHSEIAKIINNAKKNVSPALNLR